MMTLLISLLAGAALPFAFAPLNIYTFAFIAPAVLLYLWKHSKPGMAFFQGWVFGLGQFGVGVSWVYISIHQFGNASTPLAILITLLFIMLMALFPATLGYVFRRFFKQKSHKLQYLCVFPALWVVWEWLRSWIFTGFPWLFLGYTQLGTPLHGIAPVFGVYGVSLACALIAGTLVTLATRNSNLTKLACICIIVGLCGLGWLLGKQAWTHPDKPAIQVSLIQGNIAQKVKWNRSDLLHTLKEYQNITKQHWKSQLIIWPEAAIPAFPNQLGNYITTLDKMARRHQTTLLVGIPLQNSSGSEFYNGALLLGKDHGRYIKRHLVPFGEYIPLSWMFAGAMDYFNIPMSNFSPGAQQQAPLKVNHFRVAPFICYEIAYPNLVLQASKGSQMLITLTDDSWFGESIALSQHAQIAQMRALETGRYMLLDSNTGITAIINPQGAIIQQAPLDKIAVITATVMPMKGATPLMRWNYYPLMMIILLLLGIGICAKNGGDHKKDPPS